MLNQVDGVVLHGAEHEIVKSVLSKNALKISGRYIERMFQERKAAMYIQDQPVDSELDESDND